MATYYVDAKNGTDSAGTAGGTSTPWKSLSYAHQRASAGDTIRLRGSQTDSTTFYTGVANQLTVTKANLTWIADTGHKPTVDSGWHRGLLRPFDPSKPYTHKSRYDYVMPSVTTGKFQNGQQAYNVAGPNSKYANWILVRGDGNTFNGITFQNMDRNVFQFEADQCSVLNCNFFWIFRQAAIFKNCSGGRVDSCRFVHVTMQVTPWDNITRDPNAFFNFFPIDYNASKLTPDGYTGEFTNCYVAFAHGDGLIVQNSSGHSSAPFLIERNVIHDTEGFYPVASEHIIFRRNVMFNTPNGGGLKFKTATTHSAYLVKDEEQAIDAGGVASANIQTYNNLFINTSGPAAIAMRFNKWTSGSPNHANHYFGFNSVFLPTGERLFDATFHELSGGKVGPVVVENNLFFGTGWGPTPGSKATGTKVDTVYRSNALLAARSGFTSSVVASSSAMKIVGPSVIPQCVNACTFNPVIVNGQERYRNYADLQFRDNYGLAMKTMTNIDLRNYTPQSDSPVVNAARPRSPTTYAGTNTGNTLTIPAAAYDRDLWSTSTGTRADIGCFEYGSTPDGGGVTNQVIADFTATPLSGIVPLTVTFTDASSHVGSFPVTARLWGFGDGTTSTATNPTKIYTTVGNYTPTLTVTGNSGALTDTKTGSTIIVQAGGGGGDDNGGGTAEDVGVAVCTGTLPTSSGEFTLSGDLYGMTPKAVELYIVGATADDTPTAVNRFGVGITDGTNSFACAIYASDNVSPTVAKRRWTDDKALLLCDSAGAVLVSGTFNRFEIDSVVFDVTWVGTPAAYKVVGLLHGGANVSAKVATVPFGDNGTSATATAGFAPDIIKVFATFGPENTANDEASISLGVASPTAQYAIDRRGRHNTSSAQGSARLANRVATLRYATGERGDVAVTAWTSTGVTLTVSVDNINSSGGVLMLRYATARSSVGVITAPTAAGNASVNLGWEPQAVQHLVTIAGAVGANVTDDRYGVLGVHVADRTGLGRTALSLSKPAANPSDENVSMETGFQILNTAGTATNSEGTLTLEPTRYKLALTTVDTGTALSWPYVAVERATNEGDPTPIEVYPAFSMLGDNPGSAPLQVQFRDESTATQPIVAWLWDFGDGSEPSTQQHPVHVYERAGTYTVTLLVTDALANSDSLTEDDYIEVLSGLALDEGDETIVGPLLAVKNIGTVATTETKALRNVTAPDENDGTIQFAVFADGLEFSNGWAIVVDADTGILRVRKDDGSLWDFDLTGV